MAKSKTNKRGSFKRIKNTYEGGDNFLICEVKGYKNPFVVMNLTGKIVLDDGDGWGFKTYESAIRMAKVQCGTKRYTESNPPKVVHKPSRPHDYFLRDVRIESFDDEVAKMLSTRLCELKEHSTDDDMPPW